jgi:HicB family
MAKKRKPQPRKAMMLRVPARLHAQLVKAAKREGHSLNREVLLRASVPPTAVMDLFAQLDEGFRDQLLSIRWTLTGVADEAIRGAFVKMLRNIENGDLPMLLNERLAKANSDVIHDVVRQEMAAQRDRVDYPIHKEGDQHEKTEGPAAQNGPALPER